MTDGAPLLPKASDDLERWLQSDGEKTLGSLIELFEEKAFAILFVLLLGVPALPLPTAGATHVFEIIAMLLALQLIAGRDEIWLPQRWRRLELAGIEPDPVTRAAIDDRTVRLDRIHDRLRAAAGALRAVQLAPPPQRRATRPPRIAERRVEVHRRRIG